MIYLIDYLMIIQNLIKYYYNKLYKNKNNRNNNNKYY